MDGLGTGRAAWRFAVLLALALVACEGARAPEGDVELTFPVSAMGDEGAVLRAQLRRFERAHPGVRVRPLVMPDAADQRHQLFVQWLNAGASDPDVMQIDVVWTAELASAGWILALNRFAPDTIDYFPNVLEAGVHEERLYALPWFVDVGMLYWRTDLFEHAPTTLDELSAMARDALARGDVDEGLALQAARYEGLVTGLQEILGAFGGRILEDDGRVVVDSDAAVRALEWLRDAIHIHGIVPEDALGWREEQARFAFQNGRTAFMRNWPYAYALLADARESRVAGRFAIAPMPAADGGRATAALGGQLLAINARSEHPDEAFALVAFLSEPEQMLERLEVAGQLPPRRSLYDDPRFTAASAIPADQARSVIERAVARPVTPVYSELSRALQIRAHRALTRQESPRAALDAAASEMRALLARAAPRDVREETPASPWWLAVAIGVVLAIALTIAIARRRPSPAGVLDPEAADGSARSARTGAAGAGEPIDSPSSPAGVLDPEAADGSARSARTGAAGAGEPIDSPSSPAGVLDPETADGSARSARTGAAGAGEPIDSPSSPEERLAWAFVGPTLAVIAIVALFPLGATVWESLHAHDLRMPWRGRPFVGLDNYAALFASERFWEALGHTLLFAAITVTLELVLGLALALALDATIRGRGIARTTALLPWALPTVVAALLWRFFFEGDGSLANAALIGLQLRAEPLAFFAHSSAAWVPLIAADVWKTTPFAALLLTAGLATIDPALHEAARVDGAGAARRFFHITLPLLRPTILVLLLFRTLDALRVFDLVYVMTGGGPGTATEPLALYAFQTLLDDLRFGFGSAASVVIFVCTLVLAVLYVRLLGAGREEDR